MKSTQSHEMNGKFPVPRSPFPVPRSPFPVPRFGGGRRRNGGFTLIEMLVVIVIMVILMGVVFKLSKGAMAKNTYAKEMKRVAILRTLIEEFHAEYNIYPPIPEYKINGKRIQPVNFTGAYPLQGNAGDLHYYPGHFSATGGDYFAFGLMSVFLDRGKYCNMAFDVAGENDQGVNRDWRGPNGEYNDKPEYNPETGKLEVKVPAKDKAFVKRVRPIVDQIYDGDLHVWIDAETGHSKGFTTWIHDSWGREYVYISKPPYTTYLVFSKGEDGQYDEEHPGDRASEANRDNIYGNLGDK